MQTPIPAQRAQEQAAIKRLMNAFWRRHRAIMSPASEPGQAAAEAGYLAALAVIERISSEIRAGIRR